ncbi:MAG TPA: hypothetical protein PKW15_08245 [Alphaproteobacteria bacterium]|nr:hypothetical protein [Alphaproteobacteria bacterium]
MTSLSRKIVEKAIKDPEKIYHDPKEVMADPRLTGAEKHKILENWEQDQKALLRAEGENMSEQPDSNAVPHEDPAVMITKIESAKRKLTNDE